MDEWRVFGNNVRNLLQNDKTEEAFCQKLGYSPIEVAKLKEGRLLLRTDAIDKISDFLDKPREFLFEEHVANDPVHCMGLFDELAYGLDLLKDGLDYLGDTVKEGVLQDEQK